MITHVKLVTNGFIHLVRPNTTKTVCGKNFQAYDYISLTEVELDLNRHVICHRCRGERTEGPRTISEAMSQLQPYERR